MTDDPLRPRRAGTQDALVLSGGGANGAYSLGVMRALLGEACPHLGEPIDPEIYSGTSVGAFNAAVMASRAGAGGALAALEYLEGVWRDRIATAPERCGNGIFRFRANPLDLLRPACFPADRPWAPFLDAARDSAYLAGDLFRRLGGLGDAGTGLFEQLLAIPDLASLIDVEPLSSLVRETVDLRDVGSWQRQLRVVATNYHTGASQVFANDDFAGAAGHQPILASTAIPGVFPPQPVGEETYVDGAVLMNTPLKPAIAARDRTFPDLTLHVVFLDPTPADLPLAAFPNTLATFYRLYVIAFARTMREDIAKARRLNEEIQTHKLLARHGVSRRTAASGWEAARRSRLAGVAAQRIELTVHRYVPSRPLSGILGLLQFAGPRVSELIEMGYRDALHHDCAVAGCVLKSDL